MRVVRAGVLRGRALLSLSGLGRLLLLLLVVVLVGALLDGVGERLALLRLVLLNLLDALLGLLLRLGRGNVELLRLLLDLLLQVLLIILRLGLLVGGVVLNGLVGLARLLLGIASLLIDLLLELSSLLVNLLLDLGSLLVGLLFNIVDLLADLVGCAGGIVGDLVGLLLCRRLGLGNVLLLARSSHVDLVPDLLRLGLSLHAVDSSLLRLTGLLTGNATGDVERDSLLLALWGRGTGLEWSAGLLLSRRALSALGLARLTTVALLRLSLGDALHDLFLNAVVGGTRQLLVTQNRRQLDGLAVPNHRALADTALRLGKRCVLL